MMDLKEREAEPVPVVFAEFDPKTGAVRKFGSTLNFAERMKEERAQSKDDIFHSIFNLDHLFCRAEQNQESFGEPFEELMTSFMRIAPIGNADLYRKDIAVLRMIEGALFKINSGDKKFPPDWCATRTL